VIHAKRRKRRAGLPIQPLLKEFNGTSVLSFRSDLGWLRVNRSRKQAQNRDAK